VGDCFSHLLEDLANRAAELLCDVHLRESGGGREGEGMGGEIYASEYDNINQKYSFIFEDSK
jgi:hypothetical protein